MKKLTAGIFATILGLTAVDAFAAQVASTNYVKTALETLDSSVAATTGYALTGVTVVDGKITDKTEVELPTVDSLQGDINMGEQTATEGAAIKTVKVENGQLVVTSTEKLFTNADRDSDEVTAQAGNYISGVSMTDGVLSIAQTALPEDQDTKYTEGNGIAISEDNVISSDIEFSTGLTATTDATGKVTVTADTTSLQGAINMEEKSANTGYAIKSVKVENGELAITETEKLFTNSDVNAGTADAGANYLLQSVKLENGQLAAVTTVEIVDKYPTQQ